MEQEINIDAADYMSSFFEKSYNLRQGGKLTDFTIKVGDESIKAHRFVLAVSSEYFRGMLEHDTKENRQGFVDMKDVNMKSVRKAVDFIYTGKAAVAREEIADLIHVAYLLQLDKLCEGIGGLLVKDIAVESFYETKKFADMYHCKGLGNVCNMFAFKHFEKIVEQDEFTDLDEDYVVLLIRSRDTEAAEVVKYKAFCKWINADAANRRASFTKMMNDLIITELPASFRRHLVENESMVYESNECLQLMFNSFFDTFSVNSKDVELAHDNSIAAFDSTSRSIQAYDVQAKTWNKVCEMDPSSIDSFTIAKLDRSLYMLRKDKIVFRLQYLNDTAKWTEIAPMKLNHGSYPPVVVFGGQIYVIGNKEDEDFSSEKYDPHSNEWSSLAFTNQRALKKNFALCASGDAIFCIGGCRREANAIGVGRRIGSHHSSTTVDVPCNECVKLDISKLSLLAVKPMNHARYNTAAVHNKGTIYVAGGLNRSGSIAVCESYDIASDTWSTISSLPVSLIPVGGSSLAGGIYLVGNNTVFKYGIEDGIWTAAESTRNVSIKERGCFAI